VTAGAVLVLGLFPSLVLRSLDKALTSSGF